MTDTQLVALMAAVLHGRREIESGHGQDTKINHDVDVAERIFKRVMTPPQARYVRLMAPAERPTGPIPYSGKPTGGA